MDSDVKDYEHEIIRECCCKFPKVLKFELMFLFLDKNICYGYLKEPS